LLACPNEDLAVTIFLQIAKNSPTSHPSVISDLGAFKRYLTLSYRVFAAKQSPYKAANSPKVIEQRENLTPTDLQPFLRLHRANSIQESQASNDVKRDLEISRCLGHVSKYGQIDFRFSISDQFPVRSSLCASNKVCRINRSECGSGWDWLIQAFRIVRSYFPNACLGVTGNDPPGRECVAFPAPDPSWPACGDCRAKKGTVLTL
jgi:hypothetical protein